MWKDIPGYENLYKINENGEIYSYRRNKLMKPRLTKYGYLEIGLSKKGQKQKKYKVHRLVLMTFQPILDCETLDVNHKDFDKTNNNISNLEWCDRTYNVHHQIENNHFHYSLENINEKKKTAMYNDETNEYYEYESAKDCIRANENLKLKASCISKCCNGIIQTHKGYMFKYV